MKRFLARLALLIFAAWMVFVLPSLVAAQEKVESVVGATTEIDKNARSLALLTDGGGVIKVTTDDQTILLRIPAGEKTLSKAEPIKFDNISIGDRILATGVRSNQKLAAQRLVVMPVAEVARKRERDLNDWKQRGVGGIVRDVNAETGLISLELRGPGAGTRIRIETTKANFRRYVAGSLRFEDARPSKLDEVHVGDQLRALGDKSADRFVAEQIVSGAFKTIGVTVVDIDQQKSEVHATTLDQKKPITISINKDSVLHRISPPVAAAIAQKAKSDAAKAGGAPGSMPPGSAPKPTTQPVIDVQQMIDTLPAIALSDVKFGDVLAVTGAVEKDESRLVAIKVAAGVDLVLKALAPPPGKPQVVRLSAGLPNVFDFSVIPIN